MTLDNFEKSFPASRLQKGRSYFKQGKVTSLEETQDGDYIATVVGTEEYDVEITMDRHKIDETSCTCPSHDEDDLCKHVAAVLYAIQAEKDGDADEEDELPEDVEALLNEMREDELRLFLRVELKGNPQLIESLRNTADYFRIHRDSNALEKTLEAEFAKLEEDNIIPARNIPAVIKLSTDYIEKARAAIRSNEIKPALDYLLALTNVISFFIEFMEDAKGAHRAVMQEALQMIDEICKRGKPDESMLELLSERALEHAADTNIPLTSYEPHWIDLVMKYDLAKEDADKFIEILDSLLTDCTDEVVKKRLLRFKLDFLTKLGRKQAVLKIVEENPGAANEKEQMLMSAARKNGEYKVIKQKLLTELDLARANNDREEYGRLQKLVVELMEGKSDVLELRKLAEQFYSETGDSFFYEAMKNTYVKADWERVKNKYTLPAN